jgi:hypothetical protein
MLNLTTEYLDKILFESSKKIDSLKSELPAVQFEIGRLQRRNEGLRKDIQIEERKLEAIKKARTVLKGISGNHANLRKRLLKMIARSKNDNITIANKRKLETEVEDLKAQLKKECNHPFVYHKNGYQGSPSQDYENGYPSERYCIVCGLKERATDFAQNGLVDNVGSVFNTLKESEERIVEDEPFRPHPECLGHIDIWIPLGAVMRPFEVIVARALNV